MLEYAKFLHELLGIQSPRLFIVTFGLIGFAIFTGLGYLVDRGYRTKLRQDATQQNVVLASTAAPIARAPERQFLPSDIDFEYLTGLYKGRTSVQAGMLAMNYIGKWMKQSVFVVNVTEYSTFRNALEFSILVNLEHPPKRFAVETLKFGEAWKDRVSVLKVGSEITFTGKIEGLDSNSITFRDCELVDQ